MADTPPARLLRSLLVVCACILVVLVVACLALARVVLIPLVLAVLLSFILVPLVVRLQRLGLGRLPSVLLVSTLALAVVGGFGAVILLQLRSLVNDLPRYRENIPHKAAALRDVGPGNLVENIQNAIDEIHDELTRQQETPGTKAEPLPVRLQPSGPARFEGLARPAVSFLGHFALVAILVVFMLARHEDVRDRLIGLVGHGRLTGTTKALEEAGRRVSRFLIMQVVINTGFGLALGLGLFLIGMPQAFLWGLLVGALRFVPYLGSSAGALMLVALSVVIFPGWGAPLAVGAVFLALEGVTANVIEPLLFGHSTGVSPLALLFAAAFWAWLWGPLGLLLSTPLTVCLVVLGRHVPGLEFLGVLLSDEPALSPELHYYQRLLAHDPDEAIDMVEEHLKTHPREPFYDEVLLPALVMTQRDHQRGALAPAEQQDLLRDMRQILEEIVPVRCPAATTDPLPPDTPTEAGRSPRKANAGEAGKSHPIVVGVPAGSEADALALSMLKQLLGTAACRFEVLPAGMPATEVVSRMASEQPAGVVIAVLPPAGLADTRYLCKRLRAQFPDVKILVGRWGQTEHTDQTRARLRDAGADAIGTTLLESRVQILPLLENKHCTPPRHESPSRPQAVTATR